jgi:hypothetical protein
MSRELTASLHETLLCARDQAWRETTGQQYRFTLAGQAVACHFATPAMADIVLPALRHHRTTSGSPHLEVYVWDGASTGVTLPADLVGHGEAWQIDTPRFFGLYLPVLDSLLWLDRQENLAIYWCPDATRFPVTERSSPLLLLWGAWFTSRDIHLVHAAAVSGRHGAALLLGRGGSGKSSTALASLSSSLRYLGDDYCLVSPAPTPRVYSLYSSGKLRREDRGRFPALESAYAGESDEKLLYQFMPLLQERLMLEQPIHALMAVTRSGANHTRIERISPMLALRTVVPNTVLQLRVGIDPQHMLRALSSIAREVDCHMLHLGTDRQEVVRTLAGFLGT